MGGGGQRRRRSSKIAIAASVFLLIYIPSTFNWLSNGNAHTDILRSGELLESINLDAVVVRDEALIYPSADGMSIPAVGEGERVAGNAKVATVYNSASVELMGELMRIDKAILESQHARLESGAAPSQAVDAIEKGIGDAVRKMIPSLNKNSLYLAAAQIREINGLVAKKAEAYSALDTGDPYVSSLQDERRSIEERVHRVSDDVYSLYPGHISYALDGFEAELSYDNIPNITAERFAAIIEEAQKSRLWALEYAPGGGDDSASSGDGGSGDGSGNGSGGNGTSGGNGDDSASGGSGDGSGNGSSDRDSSGDGSGLGAGASAGELGGYGAGGGVAVVAGEPFAKVVRNNYFYICASFPQGSKLDISPGDKLRIRVNSPSRDFESAEAVYCRGTGYTEFAVLKLNRYLFDFISPRVVNIDVIQKYQTGLKIPVKCLKGYVPGADSADIVLLKANNASVRKVRILAANDIYAIIESYAGDADGRVSLYDTYVRDTANIEEGMVLVK
jgi:hypothetical protein